MGVIIASSRSGTCFSSCLTSSTYVSITKQLFSYGQLVFLCGDQHRFHSLISISGPCSIKKVYPREWRIAIHVSLMRVDDHNLDGRVCEFFNESAASAASLGHVKLLMPEQLRCKHTVPDYPIGFLSPVLQGLEEQSWSATK